MTICKYNNTTYPAKPVFGLKLLSKVQRVVDESEASCLATTKLCAESEAEHYIRGGLVHAGELLAHLSLGNGGTARMKHIHNLQI